MSVIPRAQTLDLSTANSLALPCLASQVFTFASEEDVRQGLPGLDIATLPLVLGGGSNLILPSHLSQPVIRLTGDKVRFFTPQNDQYIVEAEAGAQWDALVAATVAKGLRGIENLSWIPGTVGAAPVQNIGAYGVELESCLQSLDVYDFQRREFATLLPQHCEFSYRDSVFKRYPGRYLILKIRLQLSSNKAFSLDYGELRSLAEIDDLSVQQVRDQVIKVRQAKLPEPEILPNAGSFFKNPVITDLQAKNLQQKYPQLVNYPQADGRVKLAAAWLIDQAGWKGFRRGSVGVHDKQALVLVNYGGASQAELLALADMIQASIRERFQVELEIEPTVL